MSLGTGLVDLVLMRAAVSGRFDPMQLLADIPIDRQDAVVGALSLVCDEDSGSGGLAWTLRATARREQLARLDRPASVTAAFDGAPPAAAGDVFAATLRSLLRGESLALPIKHDSKSAGTSDAAAEAARHSALQFAAFAPVVDEERRHAAFDAIRARIAERQQQASIAIVLPDRLFGRDAEVERLMRFAGGRIKDVRPMLVTGIAGVGKSAVLAAVVKRHLKRNHAAIQIDFDRPDMTDAGPVPIVRELLRQLETAFLRAPTEAGLPLAAPVLAMARRDIRAFELNQTQRPTVANQLSFLLSAVYPTLQRDIDEGLRATPFLLIFDTFEVVGSLGSEAVSRVLRLETDLRTLAGLTGLRTVISGRGVPLPEDDSVVGGVTIPGAISAFGPLPRRIVIKGLADADGAAFLAARDTGSRFPETALRERLSRTLHGHPMALLVLERFVRDRSDAEIDELIADIESDPGFTAELAQAFVYERILERLTDPELRALVHPGLVLRRITPDIIRLVLAESCQLGAMDAARAAALFDRLSGQYWLVEPVTPGVVRHQPDLRRQMLRGMFAGPRDKDTAEIAEDRRQVQAATLAVCAAAASLYRAGPPIGDTARAWWEAMSPGDRNVEATYYEALASSKAPLEIDAGFAADLRGGLGGDFETLPAAWRGLIKATLGDFRELRDNERASLAGRLRDTAESIEIERQLKSGATGGADARAADESLRRNTAKKLSEAQALMTELGFDAGRTDGVAGPRTAAGIRAFQADQDQPVDGHFDDDLLAKLRIAAAAVRNAATLSAGIEIVGEAAGIQPAASGGQAGAHALEASAEAQSPEAPAHDLGLAEQQVRAAFGKADLEAARFFAGPVLKAFSGALLSEATLRDAEAGQLWATGLWQAALAQEVKGGIPRLELPIVRTAAPDNVGLLSAMVLLSKLMPPVLNYEARGAILAELLPRLEYRLRSIDGLRLVSQLMLDLTLPRDRFILFDANALALAEPGIAGHLAGVAERALPLDVEGDGLRAFAEALATDTATLADFERAYAAGSLIRWPPRDDGVQRHWPGGSMASLRGLTPELHEPAALLLQGLDEATAVGIAEALARQSVHWPADLWFEMSRPAEAESDRLGRERRRYDPRLALTLVQAADRCGVLTDALAALAEHEPRAEPLLRIHTLVSEAFFSPAQIVADA